MNPFFIYQYGGPHYFCDREEELKNLLDAVKNQRPIVLHSKRRMGKTGIIHHLHYHLQKKRQVCIYADVLDTSSDTDFVNTLVNASLKSISKNRNTVIKIVSEFFAKYQPKFSFDTLTGNPIVQLDINKPEEVKMSMDLLFDMLSSTKKKIQIAIDEFQQIKEYKSTQIDATLRKHLQLNPNIHIIFCGSQRHILLDLFNDPKSPMYRTVQQMSVPEIPYPAYMDFIQKLFSEGGQKIDERVAHNILQWTKGHTFYVQYICNRLYSLDKVEITETDLEKVKRQILNELELNFLSYKKILSKNQFKVLEAIAKESSVRTVRTSEFTKKYDIAISSADQALQYLVKSEMVYEELTKDGSEYSVYDLFLSRWLEA